MDRSHNEHILELVDRAMAAGGLSPAHLDGVAFGCGPGSFTGIRIAASVAQAIAFGAGAWVLPVSSTLALATAAAEQGRVAADGVVVSIRARRDAHYLASFRLAGARSEDGASGSPPPLQLPELAIRHPDCLAKANPGWPELASNCVLVGDRPPWLPSASIAHADLTCDASLIARMGVLALAEGRGLAPEQGLPTYVPEDSPWRAAPASAP